MIWDDAKSHLLYDLFMKKVDESFPNKSQDLWGQWETRAKWHVFLKSIGVEVLRHRLAVSYEAEAESITSEDIISKVFAGLPVP